MPTIRTIATITAFCLSSLNPVFAVEPAPIDNADNPAPALTISSTYQTRPRKYSAPKVRDTRTGRYVKPAEARRRPSTTVTERDRSGKKSK